MSTVVTTIRVDKNIKKQVSQLARKMGLSFNIVVNSYLKRFLKERRLTFVDQDISFGDYVQSGAYTKDKGEEFDSVESLIDDLHTHRTP